MYCGHGRHAVRAGGTAIHVCVAPSQIGGSTVLGKLGNVPTPHGAHTLPVPTQPSGHISQSVVSVPSPSTRVPLGQRSQNPSRPAKYGGHSAQLVCSAFGSLPSAQRSHPPLTPKYPGAHLRHLVRSLFGKVPDGHKIHCRPSAEYIPGPRASQRRHPVAPATE